MKVNETKGSTTVDRLSTSDEIRVAMLTFPDSLEATVDFLWEVPADEGGYVRIAAEDFHASLLFEQQLADDENDLLAN